MEERVYLKKRLIIGVLGIISLNTVGYGMEDSQLPKEEDNLEKSSITVAVQQTQIIIPTDSEMTEKFEESLKAEFSVVNQERTASAIALEVARIKHAKLLSEYNADTMLAQEQQLKTHVPTEEHLTAVVKELIEQFRKTDAFGIITQLERLLIAPYEKSSDYDHEKYVNMSREMITNLLGKKRESAISLYSLTSSKVDELKLSKKPTVLSLPTFKERFATYVKTTLEPMDILLGNAAKTFENLQVTITKARVDLGILSQYPEEQSTVDSKGLAIAELKQQIVSLETQQSDLDKQHTNLVRATVKGAESEMFKKMALATLENLTQGFTPETHAIVKPDQSALVLKICKQAKISNPSTAMQAFLKQLQ